MFKGICLTMWCIFLGLSSVACTAVTGQAVTLEPTHMILSVPETEEAPLPGSPTSDQLGPIPADWVGLEIWLTQAWEIGVEPHTVQARLQAAGWQFQAEDMHVIDLNADSRAEWVLTLYPPAQGPVAGPMAVGNLWVISAGGVLYRTYPESVTPEMWENVAPVIVGFADMNGDTQPETVISQTICGAHTCHGLYQILHYANGTLQNVVAGHNAADGSEVDIIDVSYPDTYFADHNGDGWDDFLVHGGNIGSVGAGLVRLYTEVWAWDGTAVSLAATMLDPTQYRHHILYEANDLFAFDNPQTLEQALALYEQAINDETLITPPPLLEGTEADVRGAIDQFAAFRLILIDLLQGQANRANDRLTWLESNYADTPITQAAATLLRHSPGDQHPSSLCAAVTAALQAAEAPTGHLIDLGYGNPSLTAMDVCPAP